ncbi:Phenylalanine-specific permease [Cupriavidus sp. H18C1]
MHADQSDRSLKRGLKNRHIQLIALGGAIGTGLFLGIAQTIKMAGPSVLLGYAIAGIVAFFIMRQLGEMVVDEPVAGSFSYFADKYYGHFAGFMSGWNYWVLYILVSMAELSAVGIYVQYWWPEIPTWVSALAFFLIINAVNLASVKSFGETEFWFSIVKVAAIIGMIGFGGYLLVSGEAGPQATVANLWQHGGFFPNGVSGLVMAMAVIMFSFGGLELVGITAAEADSPEKTIPKATNQVIYRILIFYVGALGVLLSLYPWENVASGGSPFVLIFHALNSNWVANVLNVVVLTAALSVYNSGVLLQQPHAVRLGAPGQRPQGAAEGQPARHSGRGPGRIGGRHRGLRADQLPDPGQGLPAADGPGGVGPDHQLGDDQRDPSEVPRPQAQRRPDHALPELRLPADQLPVPGLHGRHPGDHVPDAGPAPVGLSDPGMAGSAGRVLPAAEQGRGAGAAAGRTGALRQ